MRRHKYGAKPTTIDGIRFASKAEAWRYSELLMLQKAGEIRALVLQPKFPLWAYSVSRINARPVGVYFADFGYVRVIDSEEVIEDVKGFRTPLYRWKKKHVEAQYGITITEVTR